MVFRQWNKHKLQYWYHCIVSISHCMVAYCIFALAYLCRLGLHMELGKSILILRFWIHISRRFYKDFCLHRLLVNIHCQLKNKKMFINQLSLLSVLPSDYYNTHKLKYVNILKCIYWLKSHHPGYSFIWMIYQIWHSQKSQLMLARPN